jgi:16S rRNA (guanine966-N2)-methyltransferase
MSARHGGARTAARGRLCGGDALGLLSRKISGNLRAMRVVSGQLSGRTLRTPRGRNTRPTANLVRESIFNVLGERVMGARVADLYAGSGALGIEALSRGASFACFVESARPALTCIFDNLRALDLEDSSIVIGARLERARARLAAHAPFDLILCDPPWSELERASKLVFRWGPELLSDQGLLLLEHPSRNSVGSAGATGLTMIDQRTWGDTAVSLFERRPTAGTL